MRGGHRHHSRGGTQHKPQQHKQHRFNKTNTHNITTIVVAGFNKNTNAQTLCFELNKVAPFKATNYKLSKNGEACFFNFQDRDAALPLLKLNGHKFNGMVLSITEKTNNEAKQINPDKRKELFTHIAQRYNAAEKMLNLDQIATDCKVQFENKSIIKTILEIIAENCPDVVSISFGRNNITLLGAFKELASAAPNLLNLSFEGNNISDLKEVSSISNLQNLKQLVFSGNPISVQNQNSYLAFLQFKFPMLQLIDGMIPPKFIKLNIPESTMIGSLPLVKGSFFADDNCEKFAMEFVPKYFEAFDNENRANLLLDIYHDQSCLSITLGKDKTTMQTYADADRNFMKLDEFDPKLNMALKYGKVDIAHVLKYLPRTMHNLSTFVADASLITVCGNQLMSLSVHGQFIEQARDRQEVYTRAFDRNFILLASNSAMGCLILNDQTHVYSSDSSRSAVHVASSSVSEVGGLSEELSRACGGLSLSVCAEYLHKSGLDLGLAYEMLIRDNKI